MRPGSLSATTIVLIAANAAAYAAQCDVSVQLPDPPERNQCSVGSCHIFGSIGALEAALFRQTGEKIHLSEWDLFVSRQVTDTAYYAGVSQKIDQIKDKGYSDDNAASWSEERIFGEGGSAEADLNYAIVHGVATDKTASYQAMMPRYYAFRKAEHDNMVDAAAREAQWRNNSNAVDRAVSGAMDGLGMTPSAPELRNQPASQKITARYLLGPNGGQIEKERAVVQANIKDFTVVPEHFPYIEGDSDMVKDPARCKEGGQAQKRQLVTQLCSGKRPVIVSMELAGLADWGQTATSRHANHAFVLTSYDADAAGELVFHTRNSWGAGQNHDVKEDELCRVYGTTIVAAPADHEQNHQAQAPADLKALPR